MIKSFKRQLRREQSERVFESRIKNIKGTWGAEDNKLPIKGISVVRDMSNKDRTYDINILKSGATWLKYLKDTPCKYKDKTAPYYTKEKEHIEREEKERMMREEMEEFEDSKVSKTDKKD